MSTHVIYNGIELHNCLTRKWDQTCIYDESGTDLIGHKFDLQFEAILNVQSINTTYGTQWVAPADGSGATAAIESLFQFASLRLMQNRGELLIKLGDKGLVRCNPTLGNTLYDPDRDVDNGPKPYNVSIQKIVSNNIIRVSFGIRFTKIGCPKGGAPQTVINNRWSVDETMDENFFTTRTISGRIKFSHLVAAHGVKKMVVPPLETGFKRESINFNALPTGLEADYSVTDKQVMEAAPWPATRISGSHSEATENGLIVVSSVNVRLDGSPNSDQATLMARALQVVESRLGILSSTANKDYLIRGAVLIKHFGTPNTVEARVTIQRTLVEPTLKAHFAGVFTRVVKPLEVPPLQGHVYNTLKSPVPLGAWGEFPHGGKRDPATLFLLHCYLQEPCGGYHGFRQADYYATDPPEESGQRQTIIRGRYVPELPTLTETGLSSTAGKAIYTLARAETTYVTNPMRTQMPIAHTGTSSSDVDTSVVFDLARPQCYREMRVEAERVGQWPEIPAHPDTYTDGTLDGRLLKYWDREFAPSLTPDGISRIFKVQAYYRYALNRPPENDEPTNVGVLPFTKYTNADNEFMRNTIYSPRLTP